MSGMSEALWIFLPAAIANATPVFANKIPLLNRWHTPLDFGRSYAGKRIFGANKTWRGVVWGIIVAGLAGLLQHYFGEQSTSLFMTVLTACLLGFGALYGDAIKSFLKRQIGIPSGKTWFPFDQIDYIIGALIATAPLEIFSWTEMAVIVVAYFGLHLVATYIGYWLKLRDQPI